MRSDGWTLVEFSFACLFMDWNVVQVLKRTQKRGDYPAVLTKPAWLIKNLSHGIKGSCKLLHLPAISACRTWSADHLCRCPYILIPVDFPRKGPSLRRTPNKMCFVESMKLGPYSCLGNVPHTLGSEIKNDTFVNNVCPFFHFILKGKQRLFASSVHKRLVILIRPTCV